MPVDASVVTKALGVASEMFDNMVIDLPASWLRGFGQLQAAMAMPARRVELSTDVVYSLLAAPDLFDARFAFSPALWRDGDEIVRRLDRSLGASPATGRVPRDGT